MVSAVTGVRTRVVAELGRDLQLVPPPQVLTGPGKAFRMLWLSVWVSPKQIPRQELKDKQLLRERREILGHETGKAAKEGVLSSKLALWAAGA